MNVYAMKDKKVNAYGLICLASDNSSAIKYYDDLYCKILGEINEDDVDLMNVVKNFEFDLMCLGSINMVTGELTSKLSYVSSFNYDSIVTSFNMRGENDVVPQSI